MRKMELYKKIERSTITVFVDNLPFSMTTSWLWQLCSFEGAVADVFISRKRRKYNPLPFAFVRFLYKQDVLKAIKNLGGIEIRGCTLDLKEAKYRRAGENLNGDVGGKRKYATTQDWEWKPESRVDGWKFKDVVVQNNRSNRAGEETPDAKKKGNANTKRKKEEEDGKQ